MPGQPEVRALAQILKELGELQRNSTSSMNIWRFRELLELTGQLAVHVVNLNNKVKTILDVAHAYEPRIDDDGPDH